MLAQRQSQVAAKVTYNNEMASDSVVETMDIEQFIEEVGKRPALWDSSSNLYKDRVLKRDGWREVCQIIYPKFEEVDEKEQEQVGE